MPTFNYQAKDAAGSGMSGIIDAGDEHGAAALLREQGLWPTRIEPMRVSARANMAPHSAPGTPTPFTDTRSMGAPTRIDPAPFLVSVPLLELSMMYREMATLLNAGVPIVQTLATLADQTRNNRLKHILKECAQAVSGGNPLSSIMERYPAVFANVQIEMIRAGEGGGMLEAMCNRIAAYLERESEIRRKMQQETLYPKIVLFVAGCVIMLLGYIKSGKQGALGPFEFAIEAAAGGFALWWLGRYLNQYASFGAIWDEVKMMIPGPGGVARKYATARFTRALGALYSGGVLLPRAVEIAARACGNRAIGKKLQASVGVLYAGGGLSGMLAQSGLLSPIAIQMARTGEQTGSLDTMMDKVADYLESEADMRAFQLAKFAGVAALLLAACIVGYIAASFYSGQMGDALHAGDAQ